MKKSILFMLFLLLICYSVFGQMTVSGKVVDDTGEFLPSATVQIKGTTRGTMTDIDGNFEIEVESKEDTLIFSYVGMKSIMVRALDIKDKESILLKEEVIICFPYYYPLKINYWGGFFYNPYGVSISKLKYFGRIDHSVEFGAGYSTNFKNNSDFYGRIKTQLFRRHLSYKFQQTIFHKIKTESKITTHLLETYSYLTFIRTKLLYGIGHQKFSQKGIENNETNNYGINLGLSKYINFVRLDISAKSFYWQDYWAWEANITKDFKRKIHTAISYRQTTQDFKEINLTLGYIF